MADRVLQKYQEKIKPYFYTSLNAVYKPTKNHEIFLNVDNQFQNSYPRKYSVKKHGK